MKKKYRIIITENHIRDMYFTTYDGFISVWEKGIEKWDLVYKCEYNFKFTAWICLNHVLRKLKKRDKLGSKYDLNYQGKYDLNCQQ